MWWDLTLVVGYGIVLWCIIGGRLQPKTEQGLRAFQLKLHVTLELHADLL
jgi:hypothetical protein